MAANTSPIFGKIPRTPAVAVTAANTSSQGGGTIGTDIFLLYTAPAEGAYLAKIVATPTASVAGTATTATVGRVFVSSQSSGATTSSNTHNIGREHTLSSQTADSSSAAVIPIEIPIGVWIEGGESILITNHAAPAANTAWKYVAFIMEPTA